MTEKEQPCVHQIPTAISAYLTVGALQDGEAIEDILATMPSGIFLLGIRVAREHPEWSALILSEEGGTCSVCGRAGNKDRPEISSGLIDALVESFPVNSILERKSND